MKSRDLMDLCDGLSYRKLDYWCQQGVFLNQRPEDRQYRRRDFTPEDLRVAQVLAHVAGVFNLWSGGRGGFVAVYREIADQVRAGADPIHVSLASGIAVTINLSDLPLAIDPPPAPEPADEVIVIEEPVVEVGFIPGVGADNA